MVNFLHFYHPSAVIFQLGAMAVYWYGSLIAFGSLAGLALTLFLAGKFGVEKDHIWNIILQVIIFGIISSRIFYVAFYGGGYFWNNPADIPQVWKGGFSIHGAIIGGLAVLFFYCRPPVLAQIRHFMGNIHVPKTPSVACSSRENFDSEKAKGKPSFWLMADIFSPSLILSQAIGRWGNYFNQELFGQPTDFFWGIPIDLAHRPENYLNFEYFHPTFLYESLGNFCIFAILLVLVFNRAKRGVRLRPGDVFWAYLIFYSTMRFFLEFLRIDPQPVIFGLRLGQIISLTVLLAVGLVIGSRLKPIRH